jgi:hypothetical protein
MWIKIFYIEKFCGAAARSIFQIVKYALRIVINHSYQAKQASFTHELHSLCEPALPTVVTFEGGYAVGEVGLNAANVLEGFAA